MRVDQDFFAIETNVWLHLPHAIKLHVLFWQEEQRIDHERCICLEMQAVAWIIKGVGGELIEGFVLLVRDLIFAFQPDGFDRIHKLIIELNRKANKVGILA